MNALEEADKIIAKKFAEKRPHIREILSEVIEGKRVCDIARERSMDHQIIRNICQRYKKYLKEVLSDKTE